MTLFYGGTKDFGWSSDSDDVEIVTSRNCPEDFVNETIEDETVKEQCDVSMGDGLDVGDDVNLGDGDGDGINLISTSSSGNLEPFVGKEFDEVENAEAFYKVYARRKGFAMRTNHTQLSREDRKLVGVHYVCTREGFRRESLKQKERKNPELAETKIGCKATMFCKFVPEHNHVLLTPRSTSLLRGHRGVTRVQKKLILTLNESGIPTRKIMSVLSKESSSDFNTGCIGKDVENYLGNKRRKLFEEGDAQRLYAYFLDRQCKEPGFVYSMQIDENGCMENCFWADARSRKVTLCCMSRRFKCPSDPKRNLGASQSAYQYFGDIMPFVPFSGVNHHHQTIMFGCALLVNETAESYIWLLRTWQEAMLGRAPLTIITDDDKAMAKAIAEVLPNTTHRLCLWHILQKFPEHLAHVYNQYPDFSKDPIILKYGLVGNDWLENLYNRRHKWVPAYLQTTFCAGMSIMQRSESMNKFFKDYYEKALDARYFKEKEKDVRTKSTKAVLKTCWSIEEEAASVYTRKSFQIFQDELFNSQRYKAFKVQKEGESKMYAVAPNGKEKPIYYVTLESGETKATCTYHMFEFLGIVCRHILCVLTKKSKLDVLPYHYVVERWTINAKSRAILELPVSEGHVMTQEDPIMRKNKLMMQFYDVADLGLQSSFKMNHLSHALEKVHNELLLMEDIGERNFEVEDMSHNDSPMLRSQVISNFSQTIQDPQRVPTKGRPKSLRAKNPKETQTGY
ncbi:hypothetical protein I3842_07G182100 [Carya illinoinensis]|uniref:Protein FAR1-RELATED SEQUENCE n=1 Tax=Carya illinoinensis TaxID=32201 RepID=A0A922EKQ3_CARIL|nr:hypothetical protein I3842_07G182100 [Carya illinoinensis]